MALGSGVRHLFREAAVWTCVLAAGFTGVFYFDDIRSYFADASRTVAAAYEHVEPRQRDTSSGFERSVTLRGDRNGHFAVEAYINGRPVSLLADTGATLVALTYADARNLGFHDSELEFSGHTQTANGIARIARVTLDRVEVGDIMVRNVAAVVAEPGKLNVNLLGMSFIRRLTRFELRGHELVLIQ